jgi:hypothetical protein
MGYDQGSCSVPGLVHLGANPMVVKTWIEMLREKLKYISLLLRLDASVDAFLGA